MSFLKGWPNYLRLPYEEWTEEQKKFHIVNCTCFPLPVLNDERPIDFGIMCAKCGKNGEHRITEYVSHLGLRASPVTNRAVL